MEYRRVYPCGRGRAITRAFPRDEKDCTFGDPNHFHYLDIAGNVYPCARAPATHLKPVTNLFGSSDEKIIGDWTKFAETRKRFVLKYGNKCRECFRLAHAS